MTSALTDSAVTDGTGHRARLRARLLEGGGEALLDHELVEYLLGLAIPRRDTKPLAKQLLHEFGGIEGLLTADPKALARAGVGEGPAGALKIAQAAALRLLEAGVKNRPVLASWQALLDYLHADMAHLGVERVRILYLNSKNLLIANEPMSEGSVDEAAVYVREVIRRALELAATAVIIVHNHPSGDPAPSRQDIQLTRELVEAGRPLKIAVHDHVVIWRERACQHEGAGIALIYPERGGFTRPLPSSTAPAMTPRYSRPEMTALWSSETRFAIWFEIEAHALDAMAGLGTVPREAAAAVWERGGFEVERVDAIEAETRHDVIAFLTNVAENVGEEARFLHQGMTSSDVLDTAFAVQLARASDILIADLDALLKALKRRAFEHKLTPTIGRSHGIHAEPVTFGLKLAQAHAEFARNRDRLVAARKEIATCAVSGAVGTFANIDPRVEAYVAEKMGLAVEPISTQVIPRDRHAMFFATLAVIASSVERLAVEIRHLQRTEVLEAEEYFAPGQKGSSAMPHKRNPVLTENLTGLARMVRAYAAPAAENVALWHERDISHSSVERMIGPDATITLDFMLARLTGVIDKLLVYPERMQKNLDRMGGLVHSQRVLLALTQAGMNREDAYRLAQRNAMKVWESDGALSLLELLKADADVLLDDEALGALFDLDYHFKHVDTIFERVFGRDTG